ncbi:MAG: hypothetical protein KAR65_08905 [Anaerolineales bacterium]|nr:hypothetical protein [Anaerolineales bacterium]MCK5633995.1 hypothetical protein [Anaerolineales bacterium]
MNRLGNFALIIGLLIGLAGGLYYSWAINPVEYTDASPDSLREDFKSDYLTLIASAYAATGDADRARARLAWVQLTDPASTLGQLAQNRLAIGRPDTEVRALAQLAAILGERPSPLIATPTARGAATTTPVPASPTFTPTASPSPTPSPTATASAPFSLRTKETICDPALQETQIQIMVLDAAGFGVPGVKALVVWDTGQDIFFTGLKPELGPGFADFTMQEGVTYSLQLSQGVGLETGITAETCTDGDGELFAGSWLFNYQQSASP